MQNPFFPQVNLGYPPPGTSELARVLLVFLLIDALLVGLALRLLFRPRKHGPATSHVFPWRASLGNLALVVLIFLVLEVVLRFHIAALPPRPTLPDAGVFWRLNPACSEPGYNRHGLREREIAERKPPGQWRVLVLGDSSIYGDQVRGEEAFPRRLEELERRAHPGLDLVVINGGVPGYSSFQGVEWLRRCLHWYHPDLVILGYFNSDVAPDRVEDSRRVPGNFALRLIRRILFHSQVYLWLRQESMALAAARGRGEFAPNGNNFVPRVPVAQYRANLAAMAAECRRAKAGVVMLNLPPDRFLPPQEDHRQALREVAAQLKIPLVDIAADWAGRDSDGLYADNVHPNSRGHQAIAGQIFKLLENQGLAPGLPGPPSGSKRGKTR